MGKSWYPWTHELCLISSGHIKLGLDIVLSCTHDHCIVIWNVLKVSDCTVMYKIFGVVPYYCSFVQREKVLQSLSGWSRIYKNFCCLLLKQPCAEPQTLETTSNHVRVRLERSVLGAQQFDCITLGMVLRLQISIVNKIAHVSTFNPTFGITDL